MKRLIVAVTAALTLFAAVAVHGAEFTSPEGVWELEFRDSRFRVYFCDGDALCGDLVWLSPSSSTPDKVAYLNQMVVKHARPAGENRWKGEIDLLGEHAAGTIEQISDNEIALTGCKFLFFCRTYGMYRISDAPASADVGN